MKIRKKNRQKSTITFYFVLWAMLLGEDKRFFLCSLCHRGAPRERMGELCGRMDRHEEIHTTRYLGDKHEVEENGKINARRQR